MATGPMEIGVCSWSLQVTSVPELADFCRKLDIGVVQIACGDPHHASWSEGDGMPAAARAAGFKMSGAMIGFPGEDYTTPKHIERTGGFGDPATRPERIERFQWAVGRTVELGLNDLMCHAGFIPAPGSSDRKSFLDTIAKVASIAAAKNVTLALETGQETASLLKLTLDELKCPNLKVNFDPANMLLYDMGDPMQAVELLAPYLRSVHLKDAVKPQVHGDWGQEVPLGNGQANIAQFVRILKRLGFDNALCIEREAGNQQQRFQDIAHGVQYLRECLATS